MTRPVVFSSLAGYQRRWITADLVAGLPVRAVLVPEALAYAATAARSAAAVADPDPADPDPSDTPAT